MKIAAGIVTFNPELGWLLKNITSLLCSDKLQGIIIVDNGSANYDEISEIINKFDRITFITNSTNLGIATALNQICNYCKNNNIDWLITMDQDSIISNNYYSEYSQLANIPKIGIVSCRIEDTNFGLMYSKCKHGSEYISRCITAGCMTSIKVWEEIGGFDESFFIDGVDFDYCLTLQERGFKIIKSYDVFLTHEVGHGEKKKIFGKSIMVLNHSPLRLYYIARNYSFIGKKHHMKIKWTSEVIKRMLLVLLYEKNRMKKLKYMLIGLIDAQRNHLGKYDNYSS